MSNRGLAVLALRLFALFLFHHGFTALPQVYLAFAAEGAAGELRYLLAAVSLGPALLGLLIWIFVGRFAELVLPRRTAAQAPEPATPQEWQAALFAAAGLLLFLSALRDLLRHVLAVYEYYQRLEALPPVLQGELAAAGLQAALGLWLLMRSQRLSGLLLHLRSLGISKA